MSTKIKFEIVHDEDSSLYDKSHTFSSGFLPKLILEITLVEFDHKQYEVIGMKPERSHDYEVDNIIHYYLRALK